ncbi:hypothetical protein QSV34_09630 [Porticoccus sp. W117]|uniref:hypothetical protein n=1 Tax=Porticoccus sp. W117 TaxID=3054777 RepID=UPI0025985B92|nr:hypothetical protein [Porticoccus sp. W117]MDM3871615.1 hypothetical protein [Porticoccus sp. W117]
MNKKLEWVLVAFIAFVFIQSLFFKFAELFGNEAPYVTVYIFQQVGDWMINDLGLQAIGEGFKANGGLVIGLTELLASILLIITATRFYGALLALGVMSGAIFFHVLTPLGLFPPLEPCAEGADCPREYALFFMACGVWLSAAWLAWMRRPGNVV